MKSMGISSDKSEMSKDQLFNEVMTAVMDTHKETERRSRREQAIKENVLKNLAGTRKQLYALAERHKNALRRVL